MLEAVDVVITMGCGDSARSAERRYKDWVLPNRPDNPLTR